MKTRIVFIFSVLCAVFPVLSNAQGTVGDLKSEFRGRIGVEADHKLSKGLHLGLEAEARINDNFTTMRRYQAGAGLTCKVKPWLKLGGGYLFIAKFNSSGQLKPRHRVFADAKATFHEGDWNFSMKDRLQLTHRGVSSQYSDTPNAVSFKSRVKISYKGFGQVIPYALTEARIFLNAPACSAVWDSDDEVYSNYSFLGYTDTYLNRIRGGVGAEWKLNKKTAFDFYLLADYCYDKKIKMGTNYAGDAYLSSLTYKQHLYPTLGVAYKFSF